MNRALRILLPLAFLILLFESSSTAQWIHAAALGNDTVTSVAALGSTLYAGSFGGGVYRSTDRGVSWIAVHNGLADDTVLSLAVNSTALYAGTYNGAFHSSDGGDHWTQAALIFGPVRSVALIDTVVFMSAIGMVVRSSDRGEMWNFGMGFGTGLEVMAIAVSPRDYIYAGTTDGVYRSIDYGTNYSSVGLAGNIVQSFVIAYPDIFAGTLANGLHLSVNDGTSWGTDTGMVSSNIQALGMSDPYLIAGTPEGVYLSSDYGTSWQLFNSGLGNLDVRAFAVGDSDLFAGTWGGGVWRRPLSEMVTAVRDPEPGREPRSFSLSQNYSNPFNPSTTIRFTLPHASAVLLNVFNILGQKVATLVDGKMSAGSHEVKWNAGNAPSGIYFYTITADGFTATKKMILIR